MRLLRDLFYSLLDLKDAVNRLVQEVRSLRAEVHELREALKPPDLRTIRWTIGPPQGE